MMAKTLTRSKSMRLRSPRGQQSPPGTENSKPFANEEPLSHAARGNGGNGKVTNGPTRPSTSGGTHRNRAAPPPQNSGPANAYDAKVRAPPSPTVFWAAEVRSNQGAHSAPIEKVTSQNNAALNWPLPSVPVTALPSDRTGSPRTVEKREGMDDPSKAKVKRWKSLRGIFGGKKAANHEDATRLTPPFGDYSGLQSPDVAPNRLEGTSTVTTRAWSEQDKNSKLNKPLPVINPSQRTAPMPPTNHQRDGGFQGGHKFHAGTTTKPMLDVDIPATEMERYSVMFGGLLRSNTQPNLLARRQGRTSRMNPLQVDAPQQSEASNQHLKPEINTPRTQARYQLSLFPPPSPRSATMNPLGMHKPRALQRSQTSPAPRSPTNIRANYQLSISSNTLSEEVPVLLEVTTESAYLAPAPAYPSAIRTPELKVPANPEVMLLTPTPSSTTSSRFSFMSNDAEAHVTGPLRPVSSSKEPVWEMITPAPSPAPASTSTSTSTRNPLNRSTSGATTATSMTSYSGDEIIEMPSQVQVSVARSMSVTRAKSSKKYLEPKPLVLGNGASSERLVDRKPLTPTLVELKSRKSQAVQIEGY